MDQRISLDIHKLVKKRQNDLMDETKFIGLHSTRVSLLLCHLTAVWFSSVLIQMMKTPRIDSQTVQKSGRQNNKQIKSIKMSRQTKIVKV